MEGLFDVIIVGGGPAGCATAIALHNLGVNNTLILEASDYTGPRIGESIPPDTRHLFEQLGIWQSFSEQDHLPCLGSYSSWGSDRLGFNDYLFNPRGHGWHLDRLRFDQFLVNETEKRRISLWRDSPLASLSCDKHGHPIKVILRNSTSLRCRFIVDATGRSAKVARQFNAKVEVDDQLVAVSAYYDIKKDHEMKIEINTSQYTEDNLETNKAANYSQMTLLEAVDYGWWYLAHLPNNKLIVTVASDAALIKQMQLKDQQHWYEAMLSSKHISAALGRRGAPEQLHSWVAQSGILNPPAAEHWLAVGDAASTFDPISSQGIYKAIQNGIDAAPAIQDWLNNSSQSLNQYRQKIGHNFIHYLEQKAFHYSNEQRWPKSEFWQKRQDDL